MVLLLKKLFHGVFMVNKSHCFILKFLLIWITSLHSHTEAERLKEYTTFWGTRLFLQVWAPCGSPRGWPHPRLLMVKQEAGQAVCLSEALTKNRGSTPPPPNPQDLTSQWTSRTQKVTEIAWARKNIEDHQQVVSRTFSMLNQLNIEDSAVNPTFNPSSFLLSKLSKVQRKVAHFQSTH